jgi:hypothetical protein
MRTRTTPRHLRALVVAVAFAAAPVAAQTGPALFDEPTFSATALASDMALADFDRDGLLDAAVCDTSANAVGILLGHDGGVLLAAGNFATAAPVHAASADFDLDGWPDLVTGRKQGAAGAVTIHRGDGDGTFEEGASYAIGSEPSDVVTADFNGDGLPDIATANVYVDTLSVLLGHGDGTFAVPPAVGIGDLPFELAAGDFNGDGNADLAVALGSGTATQVRLLLGDGAGKFAQQSPFVPMAWVNHLAAGHLDGDGLHDLVVTGGAGSSGSLDALLGQPDGTLLDVGTTSVAGADAVATGDLDADGRADLAVTDFYGRRVTLLAGLGDGIFVPTSEHIVAGLPMGTAIVDLDGDGRQDVLTLSSAGITLLKGDGEGGVASNPQVAVPGPSWFVADDFNEDGRADLAVTDTVELVHVLAGDGTGGFGPPAAFPAGAAPHGLVSGDLNGDGHSDLAVTHIEKTIAVLLGHGDGTFDAEPPIVTAGVPGVVQIVDLDLDGRPDLLASNGSAPNPLVLLGDGQGGFQPIATIPVPIGTYVSFVRADDFNGDGKPDIAWTAANNPPFLGILIGHGDGNFEAGETEIVGLHFLKSIVSGDFDGDGDVDIAALDGGGDAPHLIVRLGNGDGTFETEGTLPVGGYSVAAELADIDGDGRSDIVTGGVNGTLHVSLGDGAGGFASNFGYAVGGFAVALDVADFDLDGRLDVAALDVSSQAVTIALHAPLGPWTNLGFALAGVAGPPALTGRGRLEPGTPGQLALHAAAPCATAMLFASADGAPVPFKGGTLMPKSPASALSLVTDDSGGATLGWTRWPAGLAGVHLYAQCAIADAAAPFGVALSNAVRADVP